MNRSDDSAADGVSCGRSCAHRIDGSWWGLVPLCAGLALLAVGQLGSLLTPLRAGYVFTLMGLVLLILGTALELGGRHGVEVAAEGGEGLELTVKMLADALAKFELEEPGVVLALNKIDRLEAVQVRTSRLDGGVDLFIIETQYDLLGAKVAERGHQQQLAIESLGGGECLLIDAIAEPLCL